MLRRESFQGPLLGHLIPDRSHPGTKASYQSDLMDFNRFAVRIGRGELPEPPIDERLLVAYIKDLAARRFRRETIRRRLCAIAAWYRDCGRKEDPRKYEHVKRAWDDIKDDEDRKKERRLAALHALVYDMLDALDADYDTQVRHPRQAKLTYLRDRALILVLYFGGLTRTEIATLYRENVLEYPDAERTILLKVNTSGEFVKEEKKVWVSPRRDRLAMLRRGVDPDRCPVRALSTWLTIAKITDGYVFRGVMLNGELTKGLTPRSIHEIVTHRMKRVDAIGVDVSQLSTHSLRIGLAGSLAMDGKTDAEILKAVGLRTFDGSMQDVVETGRRLQGTAHKSVRAI